MRLLMEPSSSVLQVNGLQIKVKTDREWLPLVHGIDFELKPGRVLGLVGESGLRQNGHFFGASAAAGPEDDRHRRKHPAGGRELNGLGAEPMRRIRGKEIALIMQNPMNAFTPVRTLGAQLVETIRAHTGLGKRKPLTWRPLLCSI
ncbi:hypothetical protein LJK88_32685 [Paenibacillus sp. P26]|nr:hypothetical protein LJK88_32685 [Paenibacillus sp. P26]